MSTVLAVSNYQRQTVLATAVKFTGADVSADIAAATSPSIVIPAGSHVLRGTLYTSVPDGGTSPTLNVGTVANDDVHGANLAVGTAAYDALIALPAYYAESTTLYVSYGTGSPDDAGEYTLIVEYVTEGRGTEVMG